MRRIFIGLIAIYRYGISPFLGSNCRYYPSCSAYTQESLEKFGVVKGGWMSAKRICRCHPWHEGGVDPVPEKITDLKKD